jgi:ribosomal protein S18 acetylase RimI-like enzyme
MTVEPYLSATTPPVLLPSPTPPIRCAELSDLPALSDLEALCFPEGDRFNARQWRYLVARARSACVLVVPHPQSPAIKGSAVLLRPARCPTARIYSLAVHPHSRGQGLARALLVACEGLAREAACERLSLEVHPANRTARKLYESCGFRQTGKRPAYYADGAEAWVFRKNLV